MLSLTYQEKYLILIGLYKMFEKQYKWLVTGCAGFIGSHLTEFLLKNNQIVTGLDNFLTGFQENLDEVISNLDNSQKNNFTFIEGDITSFETCSNVTKDIDFILHQAALGSVPRSIDLPIDSHSNNVTGFINILKAAVDNNVKHLVYASSSSVYGDHPQLPKVESEIGNLLSPYAATKRMNELYADVFNKVYNLHITGLRYFNVFGPRQNPKGAYAAVIPRWIEKIQNSETIEIYGDGENSRDFCYIENAVDANIKAAFSNSSTHEVYNIALNDKTTLNELYQKIASLMEKEVTPKYTAPREGDILHSHANIDKAKTNLNYEPKIKIDKGLEKTINWFKENL
tara:strand:+ start:144608 stop:145633 length:1026 start_codon:yes stop_codon:yes gene_type:complete